MSWVSWAQTSYLSAKNHQLGQLSQCHTSNYYFCPIFWFLKKPGCFYPNHNGILQNIFFPKFYGWDSCPTVTHLTLLWHFCGQKSHYWDKCPIIGSGYLCHTSNSFILIMMGCYSNHFFFILGQLSHCPSIVTNVWQWDSCHIKKKFRKKWFYNIPSWLG